MSITPIKLCSFLGFLAMKFCKKCSYVCKRETGIFQDRRSSIEWRHPDKYFICNTPMKVPAGKNFGFFTPRFVKLHFK